MAAFLPPRDRNDKSYGEDNGGGGFGKVRKNTFGRASRTKPYDRPPTSIRNPNVLASNSSGINNGGWLSKLVDPAQRLISASAHRLFASVFRKRLPPPPPQPQDTETDVNEGARDKQKEAILIDHIDTQGESINGGDDPSGSADRGGVSELEQILKQKTFTKSEIDRLTALLQSRTIDPPVEHEEKKSEEIPSKPVLFQERKEEFPITPVKDDRIETRLISTPIVSSTVLDVDVASPAELAKAYMGSRPSKISPSMLGLRSQPLMENSSVSVNHPLSLKSPVMSAIPRSAGRSGFHENGFVTPRSLSRSAIHSMARPVNSRLHTSFQGTGVGTESFGGSSSSQSTWRNNTFSGSKQGSLKRRSSVLDNDIHSVGTIRRIRQKSNLLPASGTLSIRGTGLASNAVKQSSSAEKTLSVGEPSTENGDTSFRGTGFTHVPSKSSEMASKILKQLDVLVKSSNVKSPAKLSPSMLHGQALKSLENVDSLKFTDNIRDNKLDAKERTSSPDARDFLSQKQEKSEGNGPIKSTASYDEPIFEVDATNLRKNGVSSDKATASSGVNSVLLPSIQKKRAFQITAHEDYLDLDDDYSDGIAKESATLAEGSEKLPPYLAESKTCVAEAITVEKPPTSTETNSLCSTQEEKAVGVIGEPSSFTFSTMPSPASTVSQTMTSIKSTTMPDKDVSPKKSNGDSLPALEDKIGSPKEPSATTSIFNFGGKMGNKMPPLVTFSSSSVVDPSGIKFGASSDPKLEGSSSTSAVVGTTESPLPAEPESEKLDKKKSLKADASRSPEASTAAISTSSPSIFQFGTTLSSSSQNNGVVTPFFSSTRPPAFDVAINQNSSSSFTNVPTDTNATPGATTTASNNTSNNASLSSATPSFMATPVSKFVSPTFSSTSASPLSATTGVGLTEPKTETSFGNLVSTPFGGTLSVMTATGSNLFGGTSSASVSTGSNFFGGTSSASSTKGSNISGGTSAMMSSGSNTFSSTSADIFGGTPTMMSSGSNTLGVAAAGMSSGSSGITGTSSAVTSTGGGVFSFNAGGASSAATNQSPALNSFSAGSAPAFSALSGSATSTQSMPIQFGSASAPSLGLSGSTVFSSASPFFSSSTSTATATPFSSGATFGLTPSTSSGASTLSSSISNTSVFGSSWQAPKSPITFNSTSSTPVFAFGGSSASNATNSSSAPMFGSSASTSSGSFSSFSSPAVTTPPQPVFGNQNPSFPFGNNDQMSTEESMAEDTVPSSTPNVPVFNQQPGFVFGALAAPSGGNQFGAAPPAGANPFQFGSQPSFVAPQNPPFQASSSLEFNAGGGSFSLGASGGDKANRKFVRVRKGKKK